MNEYGQLGVNDRTHRSSPTQVPGTTWDTCGNSGARALSATKTDGTMWAFGYNNHGQLGDNSVVARSSPVQIPGTDWSLEGIQAGDNGANVGFAKEVT